MPTENMLTEHDCLRKPRKLEAKISKLKRMFVYSDGSVNAFIYLQSLIVEQSQPSPPILRRQIRLAMLITAELRTELVDYEAKAALIRNYLSSHT
ncbi:hypothetical protein PG996_009993 [Apiospora saccharicola]|uniref:Uncharacterized protein n=1 Tax=Apiospora saccharicola TaxID=335842 RepID=A0ABR1UQB9_9PEZI